MAGIEFLTDRAIKSAIKVGAAQTISDGGGLTMQVQPGGAGWWRLRYWLAARENRLSLGTYPEISLARARERRRDALALIAEGTDPSDARKADKVRTAAKAATAKLIEDGGALPGSFEAVAKEWLSTVHQHKVSAGHAERTRIRLEQDVFPWIGSDSIGTIEAPTLLECLRRAEARGAIETAHRVKHACGGF